MIPLNGYEEFVRAAGLSPLEDVEQIWNTLKVKCQVPQGCIDSRNIDGRTALEVACMGGRLKTVKFLIARGADIYEVDRDGDTPAIMAARNGLTDVVQTLVQQGYNVDFQNKGHESVRTVAHAKNDEKMLKVVSEATEHPAMLSHRDFTPITAPEDELGDSKARGFQKDPIGEQNRQFCWEHCRSKSDPTKCFDKCKRFYQAHPTGQFTYTE